MSEYSYTISLGDVPITLNCRFPHAAFEEFSTDKEAKEIISVLRNDLSTFRQYGAELKDMSPPYIEFLQLIGEAGRILLKYRRCIFHGTAFVWKGKAWIFAAPSGTGKTTQYALWKRLYKDELTMLNGDKSVLEFCENRTVNVHPSPWKGKENMGNMQSAPLGGIILLKQGSENCVQKLPPVLAASPLYLQFLFQNDNTETIDRVCALETELLKSCPVWKLINMGDEASATLMHDTLVDWEKNEIYSQNRHHLSNDSR